MSIEMFQKAEDQFVVPHLGSTICERIVIQLQRIYLENSHATHEEEIIRLANILLPNTKTYGVYIIDIYRALEDLNYALALQVGRTMLQHETVLHGMLAGHPMHINRALNQAQILCDFTAGLGQHLNLDVIRFINSQTH